jgi:hypothetical protein
MEPESRVRVPYSPFFWQQVTTGNVEEITSKGTDIQGVFKREVTFEDSKPTTRFRTEVPRVRRYRRALPAASRREADARIASHAVAPATPFLCP